MAEFLDLEFVTALVDNLSAGYGEGIVLDHVSVALPTGGSPTVSGPEKEGLETPPYRREQERRLRSCRRVSS